MKYSLSGLAIRLVVTLPVLIIHLIFFSCTPSHSSHGPESEYVLGTVCLVNLFDQGKPELYTRVFNRLRELEDILSANRGGTDLDNVNANAGKAPVQVRPELIEVLEKALEYSGKSSNAFDPAIGPLVKLWGIGTEKARVPDGEEISKALELMDHRDIEIDKNKRTVFLKRSGMALDLGAIAKGYAADEAVKILAEEGVERGIIDLGGNIFAFGEKRAERNTKDDKSYWRIGIQDPREERGAFIGILNVKNSSVVTSGIYERFFEEDGKCYHHILSTVSGYPVDNGLLSVTIKADRSIDADALSTAAFALGWERGSSLVGSVNGAEGIFIFEDLSVRITGDLEKDFTLTSADYHREH